MARIRLDVRTRQDEPPTRADVRVGTALSDVLSALDLDDEGWCSDDVALPADHRVGTAPLLDGALVERRVPPTPAVLELTVVAGPSCGRTAPLGPGGVTIGRDTTCDLSLDDPLVSRRHAHVTVASGRCRVRDLAATNGILLGERPIEADAEWSPGTEVVLGSSRLALRSRDNARAASTTVVHADRTPPVAPTPTQLERPSPPARREHRPVDALVLLAPLVVSALAAAVLHSPVLLLLGLSGPLLTLFTTLSERRRGRRSGILEGRRHRRELADFEAELQVRLAAERAERLDRAHGTSAAVVAARTRAALWAGHEATWFPGRGSVPAEHTVVRDEPPPLLDGVPVPVPLPPGSVVSIRGAEQRAAARALVLQLVTDLPPHELALAVLADERTRAAHWSWADLLPHRRPDLDGTTGPVAPGARLLLVADGVPPPHLPDDLVVVCGPATSSTDLRLDVHRTGAELVRPDGRRTGLVPDLLDLETAESAARALCPLRTTAGPAPGTLPPVVALEELLAAHLPGGCVAPESLAQSWRTRSRLVPLPIGVGVDGPVLVDLVADGPHALVGGTTGAGKSELVTTLVLAGAVLHPPTLLSVLLVDFKGGATAAALSGLPHVCDVVTDLDASGARRALTGLEAELKRRERLVAEAGASHVDAVAGLPRLLIVVDEYRVLAEEHPAFLSGLLRVATTGRSLGVHLLLATQRPAGIVSQDVRANVSLRIALRLNDTHDSRDVIDAPDAALIPPHLPGRAVLRRPDGELVAVQVGHAGTPPASELPDVVVPTSCAPAARAGARDPLADLVAAASGAAGLMGLVRAASPVPPPLPRTVDGGSLLDSPCEGLALGLADLPAEQRHEVVAHRPGAHGHLAIIGRARSGRTTTLRQAVAAALTAPRPMHVHVVGSRALVAGYEQALGLGTLVRPEATRLVLRLLDLARAGAEDPVLVVIDDWHSVLAGRDPLTGLALHEALTRLLAEGPGRRVHVVISGDRSLLTGGLASHLSSRLVLPLADAADLALLGLPMAAAAAWDAPGRAIRAGDGAPVQVAQPPAHLPRTCSRPVQSPFRLRELPARVTVGTDDGVLGLGGDCAEVVRLDLGSAHSVLVTGPPRSGRSTALHTMAATSGRSVITVGRTAPGLAGSVTHVDSESPEAFAELDLALATTPGALVVIDDLDDVNGAPLEAALVTLGEGRRHPLLVAADPERVAGAYRGLAGLLRRNRTGLILCPTATSDGDPLGCRLAALDEPLPGRGVLVVGGRQTVVQVGVVEQDDAARG